MCLQMFTTDNRRLVVWCLRSIQFEWDILPTRAKLQSFQWNQMVLLERLRLFTEVNNNDDQTSWLSRSTLKRLVQNGKIILPKLHHRQKEKKEKKNCLGEPQHFMNIFFIYIALIYMCNSLNHGVGADSCKHSLKYRQVIGLVFKSVRKAC